MIHNVIDAVTSGYVGNQSLSALDQIPANAVSADHFKELEYGRVNQPFFYSIVELSS